MGSNAVEYNVAITGVLPGHKAGDAAEVVAPVLGLLPEDAIHLFNGIAHTVLQRADLSAAASFQAELKDMGINATVEVFKERFGATPVTAEETLAGEDDEEEAAFEEDYQDDDDSIIDEKLDSLPVAEQADEVTDQETMPSQAPVTTPDDLADSEIELVPSLLDEAERAATQTEADNLIDAFEKSETAAIDTDVEVAPTAPPKTDEATPQPAPPADVDLDTLLDQEAADSTPAATPKTAQKPAAGSIKAAPKKAVRKPKAVASAAPASDRPAVSIAQVRNVSPGSNMLCFSCNSLQPRADICPNCGAIQPHAAKEEKKKTRLPDRLETVSLVAAGGAALVSVGVWLGLAYGLSLETGFFALIAGCLVGAACGFTGGRGVKAGNASAGVALAAMLLATVLLPRAPVEDPVAPPQPDPAEVWSDEQGPKWFEDAVSDAETFMTMDGSADAVRDFMVQHSYTLARKPEDVPQADQQYFYDVDAKDLSWIVRNQPDYITWRARMADHLSGRQRVLLGVSTPLPKPAPPPVSTLQLIFMAAGLGVAFLLGFLGLKRESAGETN